MYEDGLKAGLVAAHGVLGKECILLKNPKHMVPSFLEIGARHIVAKFLERYIKTGCVMLLEESGTMFVFEGTNEKDCMKSVLKVHNPRFYWMVLFIKNHRSLLFLFYHN